MAQSIGKTLVNNKKIKTVNSNNRQILSPISQAKKKITTVGTRRIFSAEFKVKVLESYHCDKECLLNQRATARKWNVHRRQIQKWLQNKDELIEIVKKATNNHVVFINNESTLSVDVKNKKQLIIDNSSTVENSIVPSQPTPALNLNHARLHGDEKTSRQGPPPNHITSHSQCGMISPTSTQCIQHPSSPSTNDNIPLQKIMNSYGDYLSHPPTHTYQHQQHHQQQQQQQPQPQPMNEINNNCSYNNYRKLCILSEIYERQSFNDYQNIDNNSSCSSINSNTLYHHQNQQQQQTPVTTSSYLNKTRYNEDLENTYLGVLRPTSSLSSQTSFSHQQDIASSGNELHMSSIKTERASPDSPTITPVLCNNNTQISKNDNHNNNNDNHDDYIPKIRKAMNKITANSFNDNNNNNIIKKTFENDETLIKNELPEILIPNNQSNNKQNNITINNNNNENENEKSIKEKEKDNLNNNNNNTNTSDVETHGISSSPLREYNYSTLFNSRETPSISSISTTSSNYGSEIDPLDYSLTIDNKQIINKKTPRRRSYSLKFKINVLDAFHKDINVAGNQRATAKKYGIDRRQVQKWLAQEQKLRGGILVRGGDMRQRLSTFQQVQVPFESPVDLRTPSDSQSDIEHDKTSLINYCYDSSSENNTFCYHNNNSIKDTFSTISYYQESQKNYYIDSQSGCYYYHHHPSQKEHDNLLSTCKSSYCCDDILSNKRQCTEWPDETTQETPLCLVKPKSLYSTTTTATTLSSPDEAVSSTVSTSPVTTNISSSSSLSSSSTTTKKDAILFRPYLDNPISKPITNNNSLRQGVIVNGHTINNNNNNNNNNNYQNINNINDKRNYDYTDEVNYRVPVSWRTSSYIPDRICSAFTRYPPRQSI